MDERFKRLVDRLHPAFLNLRACPPFSSAKGLPKKGVYWFSKNGKALYVGRSDNIPRWYAEHRNLSSGGNKAAFAFILACKAAQCGKASYAKIGSRKALRTPSSGRLSTLQRIESEKWNFEPSLKTTQHAKRCSRSIARWRSLRRITTLAITEGMAVRAAGRPRRPGWYGDKRRGLPGRFGRILAKSWTRGRMRKCKKTPDLAIWNQTRGRLVFGGIHVSINKQYSNQSLVPDAAGVTMGGAAAQTGA
jgi:hypothetical protein